MRKLAFTLIELLVVIAIISLLLSILLPALSNAREQGKATKCLSNMHNAGVALHAYFTISDDAFPPTEDHANAGPDFTWLDVLEPMSNGNLQYLCPSDRSPNFDDADPELRRRTSYGTNVFMSPDEDHDEEVFGDGHHHHPPMGHTVQTRMGARAANLIYAAELAERDADGLPVAIDHFHPERWRSNPGQGSGMADPIHSLALSRHVRRANYLFCDGHAERLDFSQTFLTSPDGTRLLLDRYDPCFPHGPNGWFADEH